MKPRLMQAIALELQPSKLLLGLLCAISIASCAILAQLPLTLVIKLALVGLVLLSTVYFIWRDALLRLPSSWKKLEVNAQGALKLINKKGQIFEPKLVASSLIHSVVTILNFERSGLLGLPPAILFTSQENQEELRKLRVWLRWWKQHQDDLSDA